VAIDIDTQSAMQLQLKLPHTDQTFWNICRCVQARSHHLCPLSSPTFASCSPVAQANMSADEAWAKLRPNISHEATRAMAGFMKGEDLGDAEVAATGGLSPVVADLPAKADTSSTHEPADTANDFTIPQGPCTLSTEGLEVSCKRDVHRLTDASGPVRVAALRSLQVRLRRDTATMLVSRSLLY
jgi:hypothetical protein